MPELTDTMLVHAAQVWMTDVLDAAVMETPGRPETVLPRDETGPSLGSTSSESMPKAPRVRPSAQAAAGQLIARFRTTIAPMGVGEPVEYANRIIEFLDAAERFLRGVASEGNQPYFELGALLQAAAVQWQVRPDRWAAAELPEVANALDRIERMAPLVHDDVRALLRALSADDVHPFEPLD
jgi:hypothetical protein